jgi:hypothetical protein
MLEYLLSPANPMFGRKVVNAAADLYGALATPAKNVTTMFGYQPEGHTPPAPMFATRTPEYQWNLGMMKDLQREGNIPAAMDYAGRVQGARDQEKRNIQDAALGFAGTIGPGKPIRAYHGSPHDFDKFDMTKIGTGEGAQAYGHGLYFAENPKVAEMYREFFKGRGADWKNPHNVAHDALNKANGNSELAIIELGHARRAQENQMGRVNPELDGAIALLKSGQPIKPSMNASTRMYEVNIHADPNKFLDWDKPLMAQSSPVLDAIRGRGLDKSKDYYRGAGTIQAEDPASLFYRNLEMDVVAKVGKQAAGPNSAAALRDAGIPGIKYLDQGSRAAGDGSRNYVTFRDDIIEILRKYGVVPPMFGKQPSEQ